MSGDGFRWARKPEPMDMVKQYTRQILYLGTVEKIMGALAFKYGPDRKLPSRAWIIDELAKRNARFSKQRRDTQGFEL